ncbi:hypothetical protein LTR22_020277 [Elasticomyces elasticus]|nr:hypothetical protein LTR22_020277 [Elasticomyces elasticus]KAK4922388.1 hypothetical protein LTR49_010253 [Elasticomyces elasticus]KAK5765269.1 hypothetical protein LTS12_004526 [Elasticomyces elasticus]
MAKTTLDRLKALDSLPDLAAQLEEARQLCTHSARADMILKWLLDSLKRSADTCNAEGSWSLLSTIARLLPQERLATLLGTADLLHLMQSPLAEGRVDFGLFNAIASCLELIVELSADGKGAALQALLSVDGTKAANFLGAWLNATQGVLSAAPESTNPNRDFLLRPAFRVWALRKQRNDENEAFARECLVPAASLLALFTQSSAAHSAKRKRQHNDASASVESTQTLETLLARHVFLPARLALIEAHQRQRSHVKKAASQTRESSIGERLAALKSSILSGKLEPSVLPPLLDVALRCAPAINQSQRTKEQPWIENVFVALVDCMIDEGKLKDKEVLGDMLAVVGKRSSLAKETLLRLAGSYSGLTAEGHAAIDGDETDWQLVAHIIKLDANVFVNTKMTGKLLDAVSRTDEKGYEFDSPQGSASQQPSGTQLSTLLQDRVLAPTMHAFARARALTTFIDLWHKQLLRGVAPTSVWLQLSDSFSGLVNQHLSREQIFELLGRLRGDIKEAASKEQISASAVILNALLAGVQNPDLLDVIHSDVETLFDEVCALFQPADFGLGACHHVWRLLTTVFGLWFPLWAVQQTNEEGIRTRASSILKSPAVNKAREFWSTSRDKKQDTIGHDARTFVLALVRHLRVYDANVATLHDEALACDKAEDFAGSFRSSDLIQHDSFTEAHEKVVSRRFERLLKNEIAGQDVVPGEVLSIVRRPQTSLTESVVDTALAYLQPLKAGGEMANVQRASVAVRVMLEVPSAALSSEQREQVLDAVAILLLAPQVQAMQSRLGLMIQLLGEPCPKADLLSPKSAALLWQQADHVRALTLSKDSSSTSGLVELLECLAGRVLGHLLQHQTSTSAKASIFAIAAVTEDEVKTAASGAAFVDRLQDLSLVKTIFHAFGASMRPELLAKCMKPDVIQSYSSTLTNDLEGLAKQTDKDHGARAALLGVLDALARLPPGARVQDTASLEDSLLDMIDTHIRDAVTQSEISISVKCFELLSQRTPMQPIKEEKLMYYASSLLTERLRPRDYAAVLAAFTTSCQLADADVRIQRLQSLLPADNQPSAAPLLLLRVVLSALNPEDFTIPALAEHISPSIFSHRLLGALTNARDLTSFRRSSECLVVVLKSKPFMIDQHAVEATLATANKLAARPSRYNRVVFLDICRVTTILLQQYRSRLQDRSSLLVVLFQTLIGCFFRKTKGVDKASKPLTARHARTFARLLQLMCNPPQFHSKARRSDLVDDARKAQAHIGQYVQYVLHHYCAQVLKSTLGEGVREALLPGLWSIVDAMEASNANAVKSLSTAMSNSERAVLRTLYDEYKSFGKWKGG